MQQASPSPSHDTRTYVRNGLFPFLNNLLFCESDAIRNDFFFLHHRKKDSSAIFKAAGNTVLYSDSEFLLCNSFQLQG